MNLEDITIRTERLVLKVLDETYADRVLDFFIRNREFLKKWEPAKDKKFYNIEFHEKYLKRELCNMNNGELCRIWIFKSDDNNYNRTIGSVAFNNIVRGCFQSCHLGYRMDKYEINKGYMTEALKTLIEFAFNELKLHRIEANIIPGNHPSLRVVKKLGFHEEGLAKKYLKINGVWQDHIHMVLLNNALE